MIPADKAYPTIIVTHKHHRANNGVNKPFSSSISVEKKKVEKEKKKNPKVQHSWFIRSGAARSV